MNNMAHKIAYLSRESMNTLTTDIESPFVMKAHLLKELVSLGESVTYLQLNAPKKDFSASKFPALKAFRLTTAMSNSAGNLSVKDINNVKMKEFLDMKLDAIICDSPGTDEAYMKLLNIFIEKFEGKVFMWDHDFTSHHINKELFQKVILLRPYLKENNIKWKGQHEFLYFRFKDEAFSRAALIADFSYIGNTIDKYWTFEKIFNEIQEITPFVFAGKLVDDRGRPMIHKYENMIHVGNVPAEFAASALTTGASTVIINSTLQESFGLMPTSFFYALMSGVFTFVDDGIFGMKEILPKELVFKSGSKLVETYQKMRADEKINLYFAMSDMLKEHTAANRALQLKSMVEATV